MYGTSVGLFSVPGTGGPRVSKYLLQFPLKKNNFCHRVLERTCHLRDLSKFFVVTDPTWCLQD